MQNATPQSGKKRSTNFMPPGKMPEFLAPPQTVQEMLALGEMAARALNNHAFQYAQDLTAQHLQNQWLVTKPEEKAKRDALYWTAQGMTEYLNMLRSFVTHAEYLQRQQAEQQQQPS